MAAKAIKDVITKENELNVDQLVEIIDQCQSFRIFQVLDNEQESQILISIKK